MAAIWSEEAKLARWLEVELAALEGWAEIGAVPREAVEAIRARAVPPTPERVAEIEAQTQHDVAAFVDAVAEQLGEEGRWFHYGLTSSDVVDTALALQIREAGRLVLAGVERALDAVAARAEEHRETLTIGRTHGVHAEPTTFGLKLAGWAFALERERVRVARALEGMRVGKLSGAVGTYSASDPEVERVACERLGLEPAPSSTQILQRDRHAEVLSALAQLAASLERFALEIRHLARTEVREVEEPFGRGQKGSSAMPHKRNPIVSERICGLARIVRSHALVGLENVALWHERDISHSSAERIVFPDAFLAVDYMLDRFAWLIEGLIVRADRMRRTSTRAAGSTSVSGCCSRSSSRASGGTRHIGSSSATRCAHGTRASISRRSCARTRRSRRAWTSMWSSTSMPTHGTWASCSSDCVLCARSTSMPEAAVHVASGKVRELYALGDERLLLVASDRISTFDVILPTEIPDKGRVLTGLSAFWFARTKHIVPNHLLGLRDDGRSLECRRLDMLPIESRRSRLSLRLGLEGLCRDGCGGWACAAHRLARVRSAAEADRHPGDEGASGHDENIDGEAAAALVGAGRYSEVEAVALALYSFAAAHAEARGIILADTKFELGIDSDGRARPRRRDPDT